MNFQQFNKPTNADLPELRKSALQSALKRVLCSAVLIVSAANAAPGVISQTPLLLPAETQPNVFYMLDDSVSMASEILQNPDSDYALAVGENNLVNVGLLDNSPDPLPPTLGTVSLPPAAALANLCVGHNLLAYDPNKEYTPWFGVDSAGDPFADQELDTARFHPFLPARGTRDLTNNIYVDPTVNGCNGVLGTDIVQVANLPPAQQRNYANWYSYYRSREFVLKRALSEVFASATQRLGVASVASNDGLDTPGDPIGIGVANVDANDPELLPIDRPTIQAQRDARLLQLHRLNTQPRTLIEDVLKTADLAGAVDSLIGNPELEETSVIELIERVEGIIGAGNRAAVDTFLFIFGTSIEQEIRDAVPNGLAQVVVGVNDAIDRFDPFGLSVPRVDSQTLLSNLIQDILSGYFLSQIGVADVLFDAGQRGTGLRLALDNIREYFSGNIPVGLFAVDPTEQPIIDAFEGGVCQQNFSVLVTDGVWNGTVAPGDGDADSDGNTPYDERSYHDNGPNGPSFADTLADTGMALYENDLRPDLADRVAVEVAFDDLNPAQHLVTHGIGLGLRGFLTANPPNRDDPFQWTTNDPKQLLGGYLTESDGTTLLGLGTVLETLSGLVTTLADVAGPISTVEALLDQLDPNTTRARVDDMRHAAWNGRGRFNSVFDVEALINAIDEIELDIQDRIGSLAEAGVNTDDARDANLFLYQVSFDSSFYSGSVTQRELDTTDTTVDGVVRTTVTIGDLGWEAGSLLEARNLVDSPRDIYTWNGVVGVEFCYPGFCGVTEISAEQQADLLADYSRLGGDFASPSEYGLALVDYLRGDHSRERDSGGPFRFRGGHRLGDIVHSSPVFVGAPQPNYPGRSTPYPDGGEGAADPAQLGSAPDPCLYSTFLRQNDEADERPKMLYVGANDGMLHAIDADSGKEIFAYMPGFLFSNEERQGVHYLADPDYRHRYYVDATPVIGDVFLNNQWRTILVGTAGAGGNGVFVLDITDPDSFDPSTDVLFEFTHPGLGATLSEPVIMRMATDQESSLCDSPANPGSWAIALPNGYNSSTGDAELFILRLDGSNLDAPIRLTTNSGNANIDCEEAGNSCNGLSSPIAVDSNGDGNTDRIYAGDVQGNFWVFEEPIGDGTLNWQVAFNGVPLFTARDANGTLQPITARPSVLRLNSRTEFATEPNLLVFFGTGQYLTNDDIAAQSSNSFYGIWDSGQPVPGDAQARDSLVEQELSVSADGNLRFVANNTVNYQPNGVNGDFGWYIDVASPANPSAERFTSAPRIRDDVVFFNSLLPSQVPCEFTGGGFLMAVNANTGSAPFRLLFNRSQEGDDPAEQAIGERVGALPTRSVFVGDNRITSFSDGGTPAVESVTPPAPLPTARQSWRDIEAELQN